MGAGSELIHYFVYRNRLKFIRNNSRAFALRDAIIIVNNYVVTFCSLVLKHHNLSAARGLALGVLDFLKGVTGPGRYRQ